jgi:hypothetical protein
LIGGAIGFFGPWLLEGRGQAEEKRRRRAEKFEELVAAVYEFDHWLDNHWRAGAYGEENLPETASPFAKMQAIVGIHFSQFSELVIALEDLIQTTDELAGTAGNLREKIRAALPPGAPVNRRSTTAFARGVGRTR